MVWVIGGFDFVLFWAVCLFYCWVVVWIGLCVLFGLGFVWVGWVLIWFVFGVVGLRFGLGLLFFDCGLFVIVFGFYFAVCVLLFCV